MHLSKHFITYGDIIYPFFLKGTLQRHFANSTTVQRFLLLINILNINMITILFK